MTDSTYPSDPSRRMSEGWQFYRRRIVHIKTDSIAGPKKFKTDEEAMAFVTERAAEGSEYHIECLKYAAIRRMKS